MKCDKIRTLLIGSNLDFLCLSETWLGHGYNILTSMVAVPGYTVHALEKIELKVDVVVCLYIKKSFK